VLKQAMTSHLVVLGNGSPPELLLDQLRESRATPVKLLQSLPLSDLEGRHPKVLGRMLDRLARRAGIPGHRLLTVLSPSPEEIERSQTAIRMLNAAGRPFTIVLPFDGLARRGLTLQKTVGADMVLVEMQPTSQTLSAQIFKRIFDFTVTAIGVAVISPLLLAITVMLVFEQGPIFFSQSRVGRNDRRFRCYKFRTMRPDAEQRLKTLLASDPEKRREWETYQKLSDDPRITPLGHFLRKTSLDELPQLFNVLKGEMSLVGPRPIVAPEVPGYDSDRAYYESSDIAYYLRCTPGITGLWQVAGRASTTHDERIRLDRWYARNWSPWLDLMILFKTVRVVLDRSGSR
ncbi:MAG: sugar transferase, partial [Pseudomonadota bacterium]